VYYKMILAGLWAPKGEEEECVDLSGIKIPQPPTEQEIKEFEMFKTGGPSLTNFRLDFYQGQNKGPWNRFAATIFADAFIKSKRYARQRQKDVENSFLSHLRTIPKHYKRQQDEELAQLALKERAENQRNRRRNRRGYVSAAPNCG
jgi:hypothetical protein